MNRTPTEDRIKAELEKTGLDWKIMPAAHGRQIRICGRLVGLLPSCTKKDDKRAFLNVRAQIRRAAKELAQQKMHSDALNCT